MEPDPPAEAPAAPLAAPLTGPLTGPPTESLAEPAAVDLDRIEADLADVETALERLDAGTYWTDEATGEALPDELLAERPSARRLS